MFFNFIHKSIFTLTKPCINLHYRYNVLSPFSTSTLHSSSNQHSFTLNYLINSCGLSSQSALLASKHLNLSKSPNTAGSVLQFFKNHGFTDSQIAKLISRHPKVLLSDVENTLLPNFKILNSIGFISKDLAALVTASPLVLLNKRLQETALPCVSYLKSVLKSDDRVVFACKRYAPILTYNIQVYGSGNIAILLELGVPKVNIVNMLVMHPRTFLTSVDKFKKIVGDVKEMGFDPSKTRFLWAIHAVRAMGKSTWDKKLELYKKWGLSENDTYMAFEKYPGFMLASMDKISRILDFLVNTMGWERSYIVRRPIVLCFSFEKRIIPRCLLYQYLSEKGLTRKDDFCFTKWLMYSDTKFLNWVVKSYEDEGPELLNLYQKHLDEANKSTLSSLKKRVVV